MKFSISLIGAIAGTATAYPGMARIVEELAERQAPTNGSVEMIGDLIQGATTPVGNQVQNCLLGTISCQNLTPKNYNPPALISLGCFKDTCCVWNYVSADLVKLFTSADKTCNPLARAAVRMGFHDAGAWSKTSGSGGADGSLVLSLTEINRSENNGMQAVRAQALILLAKYAAWGVGAADLVQYMHNVATVVCPLGPRVLTFVGRKSSFFADPAGLIPDTHSSADSLLALFAAKTINERDLIALIGAHTTANQFFVDRSRAGQPLDSTPGVWDVKFYSETLQSSSPNGVFRLPSDQAFASDPVTSPGFAFFGNPQNGQAAWNAAYATAYVRLSLLGVNNINQLTDCTKTLPNPTTSFLISP